MGGIVGNVLEWYDFAVFAYFAPTIGRLFFPSASENTALLGAFGIFAGAYVMRPLGGLLFGHLGDRCGRRYALLLSILMMTVPTFLIGLIPTYDRAGVFAAVLLTVLRLLQGLSVGGELVGSISFVAETAPPGRRGYYGSWVFCSSTAGITLGSVVALLVDGLLDEHAAQAWGWRVPFLCGGLIAVVALWMRSTLQETPAFTDLSRRGEIGHNPAAEALRSRPRAILQVGALAALGGGGFYLLFVWWPTFWGKLAEPPVPGSMLANTLAMTVLMAAIPAAGQLSDALGRRPVLFTSALALTIAALPLFYLAGTGTFAAALTAQLLFALLMGGFIGPMAAAMVEAFPVRVRFSGIAIGYNLSLCLFGGTAPLIATALFELSGSATAPALLVLSFGAIGAAAAARLPGGPPAPEKEAATPTPRAELLRRHIARLEAHLARAGGGRCSLPRSR